MNKYTIQLKLHTLAICATNQNNNVNSFPLDNIKFEHWDYTDRYGHKGEAWLVKADINAENFREADILFIKKLNNIIPKISFISQCYTEYLNQSFVIHKEDDKVAYFQYSKIGKEVGLYFSNDQLKALKILAAEDSKIPKEFFYYWNDMINALGYSAKLLLICSAIEALARGKNKKNLTEAILGNDLNNKIFKRGVGIRNRLLHGEYFSNETDGEDYLNQIYLKIINHFNQNIFNEELIIEDVKHPHRHFYDNTDIYKVFIEIKTVERANLDFKSLINKCDQDGIYSITTTQEPNNY